MATHHQLDTTHYHRPVRVHLGWDGQHAGYWMVIERLDDPKAKSLFDHRDSVTPYPASLETFIAVCERQFKIQLPDSVLCRVLQDRVQHHGSTVTHCSNRSQPHHQDIHLSQG